MDVNSQGVHLSYDHFGSKPTSLSLAHVSSSLKVSETNFSPKVSRMYKRWQDRLLHFLSHPILLFFLKYRVSLLSMLQLKRGLKRGGHLTTLLLTDMHLKLLLHTFTKCP